MRARTMRACVTIVTAVLIFSFAKVAAAANPDLDFYKGKVVSYIVATKPGGAYDIYARLIGKYMQKYLPGAVVVVKNLPGAGHIIGANETYLAKPDGLTIGTFNTGLVYSQIVGQTGMRFDLGKYSWIGKANSEPRVLIVSTKSPYRSMKDLIESKEAAKFASAGVGSASHHEVLITATATGANIRAIPGYAGREAEMAMMRGEIDGQIGSYGGLIGFIQAKECRVLLQIGGKKHKDLKDVPSVMDMKLSPQAKKLMALISGNGDMSRLTAAPPKMPAGRLQVLRDAYKKALTNPELIKEAGKMGLEIDPAFGEDVHKRIVDAVNQPPENITLLKKIITFE